MKEAIVAFLVALVVGAGINGFISTGSPPPEQQQPTPETSMQGGQDAAQGATPDNETLVADTTDTSFDTDVLQSNTPVLVDFFATWCGPCKKMAPTVAELAGELNGKVKFYKLDVDKSPSTAAKYNVNTIPTFIVFNGGKRGESFTGIVPKSYLADALKKVTQ